MSYRAAAETAYLFIFHEEFRVAKLGLQLLHNNLLKDMLATCAKLTKRHAARQLKDTPVTRAELVISPFLEHAKSRG